MSSLTALAFAPLTAAPMETREQILAHSQSQAVPHRK
jgi:hypothetical protein